jgi:hypothetical protein
MSESRLYLTPSEPTVQSFYLIMNACVRGKNASTVHSRTGSLTIATLTKLMLSCFRTVVVGV